jgi:hypothetical protein
MGILESSNFLNDGQDANVETILGSPWNFLFRIGRHSLMEILRSKIISVYSVRCQLKHQHQNELYTAVLCFKVHSQLLEGK